MQQLPVEKKPFELEDTTTDHVPFHEGAHLVGYEEYHSAETQFDITFKTEKTTTNSQNGGVIHWMDIMANGNWRIQPVWDEVSGALADWNGTYPIVISLAEAEMETEINDELALKSELLMKDSVIKLTNNIPLEVTSDSYVDDILNKYLETVKTNNLFMEFSVNSFDGFPSVNYKGLYTYVGEEETHSYKTCCLGINQLIMKYITDTNHNLYKAHFVIKSKQNLHP